MSAPTPRDVREREFPAAEDGIFLNAASYGLLPGRAVEASTSLTRSRGRPWGFEEDRLGRELDRCRTAASRLVGADAEEVSLVPNTSFGLNVGAALVASLDPGTILLSRTEFPANVHPWRLLERRGFRVQEVPPTPEGWPDEDRLEELVRSPGVRALTVSSVDFASGYRVDLPRLGRACREAGVLLVADAIQELGAGTIDVAASKAAVLACGGQKWLCGPWGSGFCVVAAEHRDRIVPPVVSWLAFQGSSDFGSLVGKRPPLHANGRRFEPATLGIQAYAALARSLEILLEVGPDRIRSHVLELHRPVLDWAAGREDVELWTPTDPSRRAGILSLRVSDPEVTGRRLAEAGVRVAVREGALRLAPHVYNTFEEMERVVEILEETVREG